MELLEADSDAEVLETVEEEEEKAREDDAKLKAAISRQERFFLDEVGLWIQTSEGEGILGAEGKDKGNGKLIVGFEFCTDLAPVCHIRISCRISSNLPSARSPTVRRP